MWLKGSEKIHAPEIGRSWINSTPLTLHELRGRVVLLDFWDYTCVNCIRTLPYVREWDRRYRGVGLQVIGIHAPEFHFARTGEYVERAVLEFGLEYPIVLDNEYQIWQAYSNRCWPAKYLIDAQGYIRYWHLGEGAYGETEGAIQTLLREINPAVLLPSPMEPVRPADQPGARCLPVTPELYLGFERGRLGNESGYAKNEVKDYKASLPFAPDVPYLEGAWFAGSESITACPMPGCPARLLVSCHAAEINLVMSPPEDGEGIATITWEGKPLPPEQAGEDVMQVKGETLITVKEPRMYRLVKSDQVEAKLLELSTSTPGLEAYAFTFVSCTV